MDVEVYKCQSQSSNSLFKRRIVKRKMENLLSDTRISLVRYNKDRLEESWVWKYYRERKKSPVVLNLEVAYFRISSVNFYQQIPELKNNSIFHLMIILYYWKNSCSEGEENSFHWTCVSRGVRFLRTSDEIQSGPVDF